MSPERRLHRARLGAVSTFALAGLLCAVWTVRMPALKQKLGLTDAQLGLEVLGWGVGALLTMLLAGRLIGRFGSRTVLRLALPGTAACIALVGLAPSYPLLIAAGLLFGLCFGLVDVGMNTQASTVERRYGRPLMGGMHAGWSLGAVAGGALGAATALLGLGFTAAMCAVAVLAAPAILAVGPLHLAESRPVVGERRTPAGGAGPDLVRSDAAQSDAARSDSAQLDAARSGNADPDAARSVGARPPARPRAPRRTRLPLLVFLFGALVFCSYLAEGSVADWSGVYLRDSLGSTEFVAALGYPMFEACMLVGRLCADRLTVRLGARRLIATAGFATAAAFAAVVCAPTPAVAMAGFALVGLGVCAVTPLAFSLAGAAGGAQTERAIATASTMGYSGLLLGPVSIGFISAASSMRMGYAAVIGVCVAIALGARFVPRGRHIERAEDRDEGDAGRGDTVDRGGDAGVRSRVAA